MAVLREMRVAERHRLRSSVAPRPRFMRDTANWRTHPPRREHSPVRCIPKGLQPIAGGVAALTTGYGLRPLRGGSCVDPMALWGGEPTILMLRPRARWFGRGNTEMLRFEDFASQLNGRAGSASRHLPASSNVISRVDSPLPVIAKALSTMPPDDHSTRYFTGSETLHCHLYNGFGKKVNRGTKSPKHS